VTESEALDGIRSVAAQHLELPPDVLAGLAAQTHLRDDLALDSLQRMTFAVEVEDRFRICLTPEDEATIETAGDLARVVVRKLGEISAG
jgi:acyl carrier protein